MHVGRVFCTISDDFIVCITMDDGFHLSFGACAVTTEAHPNGKGVGQHGKRHIEVTFVALGLVVIVCTSGRHASSIHSSVGEVPIGSNAPYSLRYQSNAFAAR